MKHLGRIPAVAVCTVCGKTFDAPLGTLVSVEDAKFYAHKCERKESPQTTGQILKDNR